MLLSIVTTGRNDNYCGNFVQRLKFQIERHCMSIESMGLESDVEIIVVDWGSENEKLSDVLDIKKTYLKYVYVPHDLTESITSGFSNSHAWNVGARQASGDYFLHTEGDTYIPFESFEKLYNFLSDKKGENIYAWASRYMIPYRIHSILNTQEEIEKEIDEWLEGGKTTWEGPHLNIFHSKISINPFGGGGTAQLTSREIYYDVTGVAECYTKWGEMDCDFHNRVITKYEFLGDLEDVLNTNFYAFGHHEIGFGGDIHGMNPRFHNNFKANGDDWGLINHDLKIYN